MTMKDLISELELIKELYGCEKISEELKIVLEISKKDIDKASTIATLYQQEKEIVTWKTNMYYYYVVKLLLVLYWFNGE